MKLEVKNLTKKFDKTIAVNNISFKIEKNDRQRLIRAYEVFLQTGRSIKWWQNNSVNEPIIKNCLNNTSFPCSTGKQFRDFLYITDLINLIEKFLKFPMWESSIEVIRE